MQILAMGSYRVLGGRVLETTLDNIRPPGSAMLCTKTAFGTTVQAEKCSHMSGTMAAEQHYTTCKAELWPTASKALLSIDPRNAGFEGAGDTK